MVVEGAFALDREVGLRMLVEVKGEGESPFSSLHLPVGAVFVAGVT